MNKKTIYLAGAIMNDVDGYTRQWRNDAISLLVPKFSVLNPYRRNDSPFPPTSYAELITLDKQDILLSDVILANLSILSAGTSMEIMYAYSLNKIIISYFDSTMNKIENISPWIKYHSTRMFTSLKESIDYINEITK